ncbi:DNA-formamidopyrimidine glycosylase [Aquibacillus koreensis]|uniref:Formamidopyrimidine-DNA glycosylase n=1 Tax=Aquibacillus koreensis TaxID=279446 RepID=A0A9X3WGA7_9BACI|nr:DNA-formamidopyrimidine glycosylase [Aquibacillus koreensis]MCT2537191.1 DNA-formamidopyrimidine glycosylase [Aquibacillus koreensis]MDC3419237.1 DNA-formamidopyrimidine glycosylase [Aquibacillus koreensis]
MPELPEVETIRKTLRQLVLNKTIKEVSVFWPKMIKQPDDVEIFKQMLEGQTILEIGRKGKFLLFELTDYILVSHLRMEGKYGVFNEKESVLKHTHVVFHFTDGHELRYNDVRKFGTMHLFEKGEELTNKPLSQIGPDPFEESFHFDTFYEKVKKSERAIKNILLDQTVIAGLGNIYVDETLYKAGIHPLRKGNSLSKEEAERIQRYATETLAEAVEQGGTTIRSYVNSQGQIGMFQQQLFVYGQENKPCKNCGSPIEKMKVNGRGTHLCLTCQK